MTTDTRIFIPKLQATLREKIKNLKEEQSLIPTCSSGTLNRYHELNNAHIEGIIEGLNVTLRLLDREMYRIQLIAPTTDKTPTQTSEEITEKMHTLLKELDDIIARAASDVATTQVETKSEYPNRQLEELF